MARRPSAEAAYEVANQFRERCLAGEKSLLWQDRAVWTRDNLDALCEAFAGSELGGGNFQVNLRTRLNEQPPDVRRIAADLLAFYYVFPEDISQLTKLNRVRRFIRDTLGDTEVPPDLELFDGAFASGQYGMFARTGRERGDAGECSGRNLP